MSNIEHHSDRIALVTCKGLEVTCSPELHQLWVDEVSNGATHLGLAEWFLLTQGGAPERVPLVQPLSEQDVYDRKLINTNQLATVLIKISQQDFLDAVMAGGKSDGQYDEHDLLHNLAYSFGMPYASEYTIIGTVDDDFLIEYSTDIAEMLSEDDEDNTSAGATLIVAE